VAQLLAEVLGWEWIDADAVVEARCGKSIRDIFATEGEENFRQHEATVLGELCGRERLVVATGGGVVLREENRKQMRAAGRVIWLTGDVETLWQRITQDPVTAARRPPLTASEGRAEMEQLVQAREPLYRACADIAIDTTGRTPEEIASLVVSSLTTDH
jgi:shikimate kinase